MIVNQQKCYALHSPVIRSFVRDLKRHLRLGRRQFNVCFVDDRAIRRLNVAFRGDRAATDVLSFQWTEPGLGNRWGRPRPTRSRNREFRNFLGDVVISVETARRNARREGHSTRRELCWLVLHGLLHLLGYDHEEDNGEMTALELDLREQLGVSGAARHQRGC